ncbi:MAG: cupin domain-containing protein [Caulobacteraceae bacterium]
MPSIRCRLFGTLALVAAVSILALAPRPARAEIDPRSITIVPFADLKFTGRADEEQIAKVFGDPAKPGLYGIIVKWPPHTNSRPHSHPNERYITVLSGTWWIDSGPKFRPEAMIPMKPGSFVIHHAGEIHYDGARDEPAMIYIVGMGPAPIVDREQK